MEEPHFSQECQEYDLGLVSLPDIIGKNHHNGEILDPPCPIAIASLGDQTVIFFIVMMYFCHGTCYKVIKLPM